MAKKQKEKFRVVGIPAGRDIKQYAASLQRTMNDLHAEGYRFEVTQQPRGAIIVGHIPDEMMVPIVAMRPMPGGEAAEDDEPDDPGLSPRAHELLKRFVNATPRNTPVKDPVVKARLGTITMGFSSEECTTIAAEFEAVAKAHENHKDCVFPVVLRDAAELLRQSVRTQFS